MKKILKYVLEWYQRFFGLVESRYKTIEVDEALPQSLKKKCIYIVQEDGFEEQAAMLCPCGCKRILHMNLLPDERPCWHLLRHADASISLHPSIWRKKECGSHFWFRKGRVFWCKNS